MLGAFDYRAALVRIDILTLGNMTRNNAIVRDSSDCFGNRIKWHMGCNNVFDFDQRSVSNHEYPQ